MRGMSTHQGGEFRIGCFACLAAGDRIVWDLGPSSALLGVASILAPEGNDCCVNRGMHLWMVRKRRV